MFVFYLCYAAKLAEKRSQNYIRKKLNCNKCIHFVSNVTNIDKLLLRIFK